MRPPGFGNFGDDLSPVNAGDVVTASLPRSGWSALGAGFSDPQQFAAELRGRGFEIISVTDADSVFASINPFNLGGLTVVVRINASSAGTLQGVMAAITQAAIAAGYPIDYAAVTGGVAARAGDQAAQRNITNINAPLPQSGQGFVDHLAGLLGISASTLTLVGVAVLAVGIVVVVKR